MDRLRRARSARLLAVLALAGGWAVAAALLWQTSVPALDRPDLAVEDFVSAGAAERASNYQDFLRLNQIAAAVAQLAALALFAFKGAAYARESAAGRIGTGMLLGMLAMAFAWLARFPFSMAALWWHRRHDVTDVGYLDWAISDFLSAGSVFLTVSLALLVVMGMAGRWPRRWWIPGIPTLLAIGLLAGLTQPYLLPDLRRVERPALASDLRELAREQGTEERPLFEQRTPGLTSTPNAGALGVGPSERIVVFGDLLDEFDRAQIRTVLAHELAHLSRGHVWKILAWLALLGVPIAIAVAAATARHGGIAHPHAVPVAVLVAALMLVALAPARAAFSQRLETEADWVALNTAGEPDSATQLMVEFVREGLASPEHPWWAALLVETHPSVIERIELISAWEENAAGAAAPARP